MKTYKVAVIGGDGTGPEVAREGVKVLNAVSSVEGFKVELTNFDFGGERYLKTGEVLPANAVEELKKFDTILLGAIGHPDVKPGILEKGILLKLRFELDQYINLRPVKLYENVQTPLKDKGPKEIDYVIVRENTGGIYTGIGGIAMEGTPHELAVQEMVYNRFQVDRCLKWAFEYTKKRNRKNTLALSGKTNVLTYVYGLWERAFHEMGDKNYPDIKREYYHVDATCMWIITDLAAITQGGMGIAAGGNINPEGVSMFEPIGGSAPKYTGQNIINPMAAIGSVQMMLDIIGEDKAAKKVEDAMKKTILKIKDMGAGKMGMSTTEVGDDVAKNLS